MLSENLLKMNLILKEFPLILFNRQINTLNTNKEKLTNYSKRIWHQRHGHFYLEDLGKYIYLHNAKEVECLDCKISKVKKISHNRNPPKTSRILETIHSDEMGPINKSVTGKNYILIFSLSLTNIVENPGSI